MGFSIYIYAIHYPGDHRGTAIEERKKREKKKRDREEEVENVRIAFRIERNCRINESIAL